MNAANPGINRRDKAWPPLATFGLWLLVSAGLAAIAHLCARLGLISNGLERGLLPALALTPALYLMMRDRRSMADCGLVADRRWKRHALAGLLLGFGVYACLCMWGIATGVFLVETHRITAWSCGKALLGALGALPIAVMQQIIFSGYLPSMLRQRHGRLLSVMLPALVFGIAGGMGTGLDPWLSAAGLRLTVGMTLIGTLLTVLRLRLGSLAFPAGLLAGAMIVRRLAGRTSLLNWQPAPAWSFWLAPSDDPRQAPVMWAVLIVGLAVAGYLLWRDGEYQAPADQPAIDASFKRIMPLSNLLGLAPLDLWLPLLVQARFQIGLKYLPRLAVSLVASSVNTLLCLPERFLAPLILRHPVPDPVFIVGVHRSGTTHLHNLLSLDSRFCTPRGYQVFNPHGFLSGWLTTLVVSVFVNGRRPMDAVQISMFSPQEEEFAVAAMCRQSPYWSACFPREYRRFERFIYPEKMTEQERRTWSRQLVLFLRKVTCFARTPVLLKSPYNTARVAALRELFPRAKFIHIVRDPYVVVRSNLHLAEHGWAVFQLQDPDPQDSYGRCFLDSYREQEQAFEHARRQLPAGVVADVRFEDLEADPIGQIRRLYAAIGLEYTLRFHQRLTSYLANIADYRKNSFQPLPDALAQQVDAQMGAFQLRWGYPIPATASQKRAA